MERPTRYMQWREIRPPSVDRNDAVGAQSQICWPLWSGKIIGWGLGLLSGVVISGGGGDL